MSFNKNNYRSHDYKFLVRRWRTVCRIAGLKIKKVAEIDGFPCFEITSRVIKEQNVLYLSAGIHGDESGSTEGLLAWAESNVDRLKINLDQQFQKYLKHRKQHIKSIGWRQRQSL